VIDLQSHSFFSDGELSPTHVVAAAREAGVTTLALTDHDSIDGVAEAAQAAREERIVLVPATELSCVHGRIDDMHMLGYWVDTTAIAPACERAQQERITRAGEIVERLNAQGVSVRLEDAIAEAGEEGSVGRPHIAKAAGIKPDQMSAFFEEWLVPGAKAFVARRWPDAREASSIIHQAGGAAVLAHPFWDMEDAAEITALVDELDLDGVECFYPSHDRAQTEFLLELCRERGLACTGSSDFHGPNHKMFNSFGSYPTYDLGVVELPPRPND
jgi:3',5'-nucleoside bisphosphate phosphatase